jgi:hypothetical protein
MNFHGLKNCICVQFYFMVLVLAVVLGNLCLMKPAEWRSNAVA